MITLFSMQLHSYYMDSFMQKNTNMPENMNNPSSSTQIVCLKLCHPSQLCNNCDGNESCCWHAFSRWNQGCRAKQLLQPCLTQLSCSSHTSSFRAVSVNAESVKESPPTWGLHILVVCLQFQGFLQNLLSFLTRTSQIFPWGAVAWASLSQAPAFKAAWGWCPSDTGFCALWGSGQSAFCPAAPR